MTYSATTTWEAMHGKLLLAVTIEPVEVGRRLKAARERKGWTQLGFALEASVSPSSVARWEAGKLPPVRELVRVCDLLEIDAGELVESREEIEELRQLVRQALAGIAEVRQLVERLVERAAGQG